MALRIAPVNLDTVGHWRVIHNIVVPPHPLSDEDVRERLGRNVLTLAYEGDVLVGNATIRPPERDAMWATVIVRILPAYRRQGFGSQYLSVLLNDVRNMRAGRIETVVLASNTGGLSFATHRGFVEFDRYVLDDQAAEYIDLVLAT